MKKIYIILLAAVALIACHEDATVSQYQVKAPSVSSFEPMEGEVGTEVTIYGENLTRVDTVLFGTGLAQIKYRISDKELVAEVKSTTKSGPITVSNTAGKYTTEQSFQVKYSQPTIDEYPTTATVYDQVVITGWNLHFITAVLLDGKMVNIVAQRKEELVFSVPYHDDETPVTLRFSYFDGTEDREFGPEGATFIIQMLKPVIATCPDMLEKYHPITIEGEYMDLIDSIFLGDLKADIRLKNEEKIEIDVPANYFDGPFTCNLRAVYYGVKEMVIKEGFQVVADPNEPRYNVYKHITLSGRQASGGTENSFFDADLGLVISSCEAEDNMMAIDFFLYDNTGYAQLYSPSNATNTAKNFKCDGVSITATDPNAWNAFYQTDCLFRVLDPTKEVQKAIIDAYEAGTIVKLDEEFFAGVAAPSGKAPRVYKTDEDRNAGGTSHFSSVSYAWGWVKNMSTGKNGIIKITDVVASEETGKTYEVSFDIIWEK